MSSPDPLLEWRARFPITERTNYLISNSLGAMPSATRESMGHFLDLWDRRGVRAWADEWWELQFQVSADVERILGVDRQTVSMHQNVAMASEVILSCFDPGGKRNRIVFTDLNFPSVMYLYEAQVARGAEIVRVPSDDGVTVDTERLLDAIDERTLLVPISHVLFRSAFIQDAAAVVEKARTVGAFVILDVFQSVGTVPLKLRDWGVHAAVGGALKYLCGGAGNCFLYVDPGERAALTPSFTGWAADKRPFDFASDGHRYREDHGRFLNGTPNVPALYAGRDGLRIVAAIGGERIREKSMRLTALLVEEAGRLGFKVNTPRDPEQRGGHVPVDVPDGYAVCQALLADDIVVDYRPGAGIRMAPHFYNTEDEVRSALRRMAEIVESGAYRPFLEMERRPG